MDNKNKKLLVSTLFFVVIVLLITLIFFFSREKNKMVGSLKIVNLPGVTPVYLEPFPVGDIPSSYPEPATEESTTRNDLSETDKLTVDNIQRTTLIDAKKAYDNVEALFLDVRSQTSFARNHIVGAINIPEQEVIDQYLELDPNQWIITYCS